VDGSSVMDVGNNSGGGWRLNMDIIAEFKVLTNGETLIFNTRCEVQNDPDRQERSTLES